jgi:hypothetical protein
MKTTTCISLVVLVLGACFPCRQTLAADKEIDYDIFSDSSRLTVWVDLAPFLGAAEVEQMRDGIDIILECKLTLSTPRRFFGERSVATQSRTLLISNRPVTEDYVVAIAEADSNSASQFISFGELHRYLRDSVEIVLTDLDSLDPHLRYVLELRVSTIHLTDMNLSSPKGLEKDQVEPPVRFLFRQFLELTGYGRDEFSTKSRKLSLSEIPAGR